MSQARAVGGRADRRAGRSAARSVLAGGLLALAAACGEGRPDAPPRSVLLVTLDTTRRDALGAYADAPRTPHLDALAAQGITYRSAYTVTPLTQPSHASVMTGLYPPRHGVRINGVGALSEEARTLAEAARAAGFETAAFYGALVLDEIYGLDQGFERYLGPERVPGNEQRVKIEDRRAGAVVDDALAWLAERAPERRYFAWVHVFDPHAPYEPPEGPGPDEASPEERYAGEVSYVDRELGRLLEAFLAGDPARDPLVAVIADHGEAFGEHGEKAHGLFCYDATIRVPFLLRYPDGWRAGERTDEIVSAVDLHPTLAEAMGLAAGDVDGQSLYYRDADPDRGVYFESYLGYLSYGTSPLAGWVDAGGKYLHSAEPELFASGDHAEERDLAADPARARELGRYRAALAAVAERPGLALDHDAATAELAGALQDLGYASAGATRTELPSPLDSAGRASPRRMRQAFDDTQLGMRLFKMGRFDQSAEVLARVVEAAPDNHFAIDLLANARMQQGLFEDAVRLLRRVVAEGPGWPGSWFNLGLSLVEVGEREQALEPLRRAVLLAPHEEQFRRLLIDLLRSMERDEEADLLEGAAGDS